MEPIPRDLPGLRRAVGAYLAKWRVAAELSQPQIAEEVKVTQHYVSLLERGRRSPSAPVLRKIAGMTKPPDADITRARLCLAASKIRDDAVRAEVIDLVSRPARHLRAVPAPAAKSSRLERELEKDLSFMAVWNRVAAIYRKRGTSGDWLFLWKILNSIDGLDVPLIPAPEQPTRPPETRGVVGAVRSTTRKNPN